MEKFGVTVTGTDPEEAKAMALENFVNRVVEASKKVADDESTGISVGFSDDDLGNIKMAEEFIIDKLKKSYPNVKFIVYDTSDPDNINKKRIVVTK
jgi:hypothetical protein